MADADKVRVIDATEAAREGKERWAAHAVDVSASVGVKVRQDVAAVLARGPLAGVVEESGHAGGLLIVRVDEPLLAQVTTLVATVVEGALGSSALAEHLRTQSVLPSDATARGVLSTERAWRDVQDRYGLMTGADVADLLGSRAKNRHEYAASQVKRGALLGIRRGGRLLFPGFQFDRARGVVRPGLIDALRVLTDGGWDPESVTLWFTAPHGALDDREPAEVLATDPGAVLEAARAAVAHW